MVQVGSLITLKPLAAEIVGLSILRWLLHEENAIACVVVQPSWLYHNLVDWSGAPEDNVGRLANCSRIAYKLHL